MIWISNLDQSIVPCTWYMAEKLLGHIKAGCYQHDFSRAPPASAQFLDVSSGWLNGLSHEAISDDLCINAGLCRDLLDEAM
jgi:hypothetical protein